MRVRKGLLFIGMSVVGAMLGGQVFAASCSGTPVTLRFANWASAEAATAKEVNQVAKVFEEDNPCVKIKNIALPYNSMLSQLTIMAVGNNMPDVVELSSGWPQVLAGQGALANLKGFASTSFISENFPAMLEDGTYQGKLVAVPLSLTPHGFWYNKKLMAEAGLDPSNPPRTIAELDHDMSVIKQNLPGVWPLGIMSDKALYTTVENWPWLQAFCATPPMADHQLGWTRSCTIKAFEWLQSLAKKGYILVGQDIKDNRQLLSTNKEVFEIDGPYLRGIIASINPEYKSDKAFADAFGVTTVPVGPSGVARTAIDIHLIGMSATAPHPEVAWKFIKFMVGSQASVRDFLIPEGGIPPLKSSQTAFKAELSQSYQQAWIKEIIPTARPIPYNPLWQQAANHMIDAVQLVLNGANVKTTLKALESQLQKVYPTYNP